jgi:fructoselysine-6-P-deglycase FrlB-like protein
MKWVEALKHEMENVEDKVIDGIKDIDLEFEEAYLVGSGDSYSASIIVEEMTRGKAKALDPLSAINQLDNINKPLIIVSVSGKPRENIELAVRAKNKGIKTFALTSVKGSPLAKACDEAIIMNVKRGEELIGYPLPGAISYLITLASLLKIFGLWRPLNFKQKKIEVKGNEFFIGSPKEYGNAYFSALKSYEFFGFPARAERLEQFCHAAIFSALNNRVIIIHDGEAKAYKLIKGLENLVEVEELHSECEIPQMCNALSIINSFIDKAEKISLEKPFFAYQRGLLKLSDELIY